MNQFKVGDRIIRTKGDKYHKGDMGVIDESYGDRYRIVWDGGGPRTKMAENAIALHQTKSSNN